MAHTKSTQKRIKQDRKKQFRNMSVKSSVKTVIKKYTAAVEQKDAKIIAENLKEVYKSLDRAVSKGVIPKGTASRRKSRLAAAARQAASA